MYKDNEAYKEFVRSRIDGLRIRKNISEYKLSLDLGKSQGYIQSITSGRTMPSLEALCDICSYFEITPTEFFDSDIDTVASFAVQRNNSCIFLSYSNIFFLFITMYHIYSISNCVIS